MFKITLFMPKARRAFSSGVNKNLSLCKPGRRAFSSVGRASPLQGEGQKFESSNAHHKNPDDISYLDFYFAFRYESSPSQRLEKKFGGFADGRRERSELVRIARKLSLSEPKVQKRNFPSVEQIQDESSNAHHKRPNDIDRKSVV